MKPAFDIWNSKFVTPVVFLVITAVICKRQNPRSDQIERVLNKTHSILWDCRHTECNPGNGLNVQCGTSVPFNKSIECVQCKPSITYSDTHDYSTCKICRKCKKHEEKIGYCSVEEDTTKCLGTCENDYYWENNTCHPCSDCCGEKNISEYHEKQCENSALPISRQCRKTVCEHPANPGHQNRSQEGGAKSGFSLEAVYICTPLAVIVIAICSVLAWMRRKFGWKETKAKVKIFFRCIPCSSLSVSFSEEISDVEEATDKIESLNSVPCSDKRPPCFQRLLSAPPEVHFKDDQTSGAPKIIRSVSHPGCLTGKRVTKEQQQEIDPVPVMKCSGNSKVKMVGKKKYVSVPECEELTKSLDPGKDGTQRDRNLKRLNSPSFPVFKTDQYTSTSGLHCLSSGDIESVPKDFQKKLLSWRVSKIRIQPFYRNICNQLNQRREYFLDDYRLFGEKIGLGKDEVSVLGQGGNPTHSLIQKFDSIKGSSVGKFQKVMEEMERDDVVTEINEWIVYEWNIFCNSSPIA